MNYLLTLNGTQVWATDSEARAIATLEETRHGGCASVQGYVPSSNWTVKPVQNIQFLSRVSTAKLYARRLKALESISYGSIADSIVKDEKLAAMTHVDLVALFEARKQMEMDSITKTQDGDRSDANRQGHDRCYVQICTGVKVNLITEKGNDGLKHPVLIDGYPSVASIMVSALFLNVTTVKEGTRKVVNSGAPVRMGNIIKSVLSQTGLNLKMLSLKPDNFDKLTIDKNVILADELWDYLEA